MTLPKTPSFRLEGKRALVTGASSGIGLASAVALAEAGAQVVMAARGEDRLTQAVHEVQAAGYEAEALVLDVTDPDAVAAALAQHGPFDILCNSAGLARHSAALDTDPADYDAVMAVNVRAAYFLATGVARGLRDAGKPGSLIQISSQMGHVGGMERAVYCASKHAIEGMNKAMAIEFGPMGIRVNSVCPTFIRTPLSAVTLNDPEKRAWIEGKIRLGRVGELTDIMGPVVFLASDAAALITGTSVLVDGGWTAG